MPSIFSCNRLALFPVFMLLLMCVASGAQCTQPPTVTIGISWDPDALVQVNNSGVPGGPLGTALGNWTLGLSGEFGCDAPAFSTSFLGPTAFVNLSYTSSIPTQCTSSNEVDQNSVNGTLTTRGCTDVNHAQATEDHRLGSVNMYVFNQVTASAAVTEVVAHEFGHTLALSDCTGCAAGSSVMTTGLRVSSINATIGQPGPTPCDLNAVATVTIDYFCSGGDGSGCDDPETCCVGGSGGTSASQGPVGEDNAPVCSPIIIDTEGEGFHLTSAAGGVSFDISGTGRPIQIAWTDAGYHNAFLALPGPDGLVHNGTELFGNFTTQPASPHPNGFIALAQYDKLENGGNSDGIIDDRDRVFSQLRLWIDENHDGICQPNELHTLAELGIYSLALNYTESQRTDQFGNQFRYKAQVNPGDRKDPRDQSAAGQPARWTYDVFLTTK